MPPTENGNRFYNSSLMGEVALALLGRPNGKRREGREWRYGTHGSLCIDLRKNVYYDYEAGQGGGVLDLIARVTGGNYLDAIEWLDAIGLLLNPDARKNGRAGEAIHKPDEHDRGDTKPNGNGGSSSRIVATYDYIDESGQKLFEVVRYDPKSFRQRRPDGHGGHIWNLDGVRRVLYRLPELIKAVASGRLVFLVEGEKDADNLYAIGIPATTNPMGAGKWRDEYSDLLRGAVVVVVPDNDSQQKSPTGDSASIPTDSRYCQGRIMLKMLHVASPA